MSDQDNVFTRMNGDFEGNKAYQTEGADYFNPEEFKKLVMARRSVRKYTSEKIPDHIVNDCLDLSLLAPNSSNLQQWEFYRIINPDVRKKIVHACFSQSAAATAPELIVCVSRRDKWRQHSKQMLEEFKKQPVNTPAIVLQYYGKLIPIVYTVGWFNVLTPFKWLMNTVIGIFKVVPREPISSFSLKVLTAKSCALACENLMLAFRAHGYDTCPMEGFDSLRVKNALNLPSGADVTMVISAGRRAEGGIYGPRMRFAREQFIKTI